MAELLLVEAAAALGVSVDTIRRRVKRGELAAHADGQGRLLVALPDDAMQPPSTASSAAEHAPSSAVQAAEQVLSSAQHDAQQRLADAQQARLEALRDQLDAAQSEVSFLRDELRRRDDGHEREREQWHERLHEALAALAMQRAA